ncbi:MAG TPA: Verru_Chthon cassette protein B [Candidatus Methylacidiphilales bacterium]
MKTPTRPAGFSLIEVVIAIGVVSLAILPLIALLPAGLKTNRSSTAQTGAMGLLTAISADIRTAASGGVSPRYGIQTGAAAGQTLYFDEAGTLTSLQPGKPGFKARIQPVALSSTKTVIRVTVTWPPQASSANVLGSADVLIPVGSE